ncbi:MAG TPA: slipin family protein [Chloroflexota bacterium]|nr:slipin family protein [Chloroflexota bacterium]
MIAGFLALIVFIVVVVLPLIGASVKVVQEYERGVIFRLGRLVGVRGPGLFFILPFFDRMVKIDLRTVTLEIPPQEVITRDNVSVKVSAVAYFRVVNPQSSVVEVANYQKATFQIAQTTLRSVLGQFELDEVLGNREDINRRLQQIIDEQTEPWGIKVTAVDIKDIELPPNMQSAIARQAEAEREKRAKIINAEGELQAAQTLSEAARVITAQAGALQLRYLQTLADIGEDKNSTIVITDIGGLVTELRDTLPLLAAGPVTNGLGFGKREPQEASREGG